MTALSLRIVSGSVAAALALSLAACSAADTEEAAAPVELSPAAAAAQGLVDAVSGSVQAFEAPGPELGDLSSLAGSTVYYVPATLQVPMFANLAEALGEALSSVDVELEVCDGKGNPGDMASCLTQAVDAGAGAVIAGSFPYELAPVAFDAVVAAGIPLLYMQTAPAGPGDPAGVAYLTPDNIALQVWLTNWVIADSNAEANVLAVKVTDTPATTLWTEVGALGTYAEACPDCTVEVIEVNTGQFDKLASQVSAALVANPEITYVHAAFDSAVQSIVQGIQAAGRDDVVVVSMDGSLPVMQDLASENYVAAEVGFNQQALSWYAADQVLRMMAGQESVQNLEFPFRRLFTRDIAAELEISPETEKSGAWYGESDFRAGFLELWGAN